MIIADWPNRHGKFDVDGFGTIHGARKAEAMAIHLSFGGVSAPIAAWDAQTGEWVGLTSFLLTDREWSDRNAAQEPSFSTTID